MPDALVGGITHRPPSPRSGARTAASAVAITIVSVLPVFLLGGLAVQVARTLHFSPAGLGVAVATYFAASALAAVPAGRIVERYGSTVTARAAVLISAATLLAIALLARTYPALVALLAAGATANAFGQLSSNLLLADRAPAHRLGLTFGIKQSAIPVATLLSGAAVPVIALTLGWRWAFGLAAAASLGVLAAVPRTASTGRPARERSTRGGTTGLVVVGLAATLAAGGAGALGTFVVASSVERGLAPGPAGLVLTLGSAVCVAARLAGGWLADRRRSGHLLFVAALLGTGSAGLALLAAPGSAALVVGVVLGFGLGWSWPGVMNFAVVRLNPHAPAAATSITQTGVYAGGAIGPLGFGALAARSGYPTAWMVAAIGMLLAAALMLVGRLLLRRAPTG